MPELKLVDMHRYHPMSLILPDVVTAGLNDMGINCAILGEGEQPTHEVDGRIYTPLPFGLEVVTSAKDEEARAHVFTHSIIQTITSMMRQQVRGEVCPRIFVTVCPLMSPFRNSDKADPPYTLFAKVSILIVHGLNHEAVITGPQL
jgi:hypothetical protein